MKNSVNRFFPGLIAVFVFALLFVVGAYQDKAVAYTPVAGSIVATPDTINSGSCTKIKWNSFNATHVSISPTVGSNLSPSGEKDVCPTQTTTYTLSISNDDGGQGSGTATVYVSPVNQTDVCPNISGVQTSVPSGMRIDSNGNCVENTSQGQKPEVTIHADDTRIDSGDETTIRWSSVRADYCTASRGRNGWAGSRSTSGRFDTDDLTRDTTYEITCYNNYGSDSDSVTVRVEERDNICQDPTALNYRGSAPCRYQSFNNQPTVGISADNTNLPYNGSTTVRWFSTNATTCTAYNGSSGWAGPKNTQGSFFTGVLSPGTRTYTITCSNNYGSATDSVAVSVRNRSVVTPKKPAAPRAPAAPAPTYACVVLSSEVDQNQTMFSSFDNRNPQAGSEITYTVTYQNPGTTSIKNMVLRIDLPYEAEYVYSTPTNPARMGSALTYNLGTLGGNQSGTVTTRFRVRPDVQPGTVLNFPSVLSYDDGRGYPQTVTGNASAFVSPQYVSSNSYQQPQQPQGFLDVEENNDRNDRGDLGAKVLGSGFFPNNLFGWLLLIILILVLVYLFRYLAHGGGSNNYHRSTTVDHH